MSQEPDVIDWLLQAATPSIRYLTLTDLQERPADDPEVNRALRDLHSSGPVPAILARQSEGGNWLGERSYYTPKYTSTHWSMMLLAELQACQPSVNPAAQRGAQYMLKSTRAEIARNLREAKWDIHCLWGNILRCAVECGLQEDPATQGAIQYLAACGIEGAWRCPHNGNQPCAWGAARTLWGLAAAKRASLPGVDAAIASGIRLLLEEHSLVDADYRSASGQKSSLWTQLNFPLFYQADILFVLRVLAELNALDHPGARPALEWLASRQDSQGRWSGNNPFRQRTYRVFGGPEETRRWATLQALRVLKQGAY
jgi:hypothetical protein